MFGKPHFTVFDERWPKSASFRRMWIGPRGSTFSTSRSQFNTLRCFQVNNLRQSYETKIFLREKLLLTNQIFPSTDYIRLPLAFLVHNWCSCQRSFSTVLCHMWYSPQFYFQGGLFSKTLFFFTVRFVSVVQHWYCWIVSRLSKMTYVLPPKPHVSFKLWTLCCLWASWIRTVFLRSRLYEFCK